MSASSPPGEGARPVFRFASRLLHPFGAGWPRPIVTTALIAACIAVAIVERFAPDTGSNLVFVPVLAESEPYRFLSSAFLHSGFWHVTFNMYALWLLGYLLEPLLGRTRFLAVYLLSAVAGNAAVLLTSDELGDAWITATVGASGAVFGLLGAQLAIARISGVDMTNLLVVIGLNLAIGFMPGMNISWQSHMGGFIMGIVFTAALARTRNLAPKIRPAVETTVTLVAGAALVAIILWGLRG